MNLDKTIDHLMEMAPGLMRESSQIALRHYADMGRVIEKQDKSPLTAADLEIDAFLHARLSEAFPGIAIVTEEQAETHDQSLGGAPFFLVDPIDGTKEFINRRDEFTVNIALVASGRPVAGMVAAPALDRCYLGAAGRGASLLVLSTGMEGPIAVRAPDNAALAIVASRSHMTEETSAFVAKVNAAELKNAGSSLKFCLLASGEADLYPRFGPTMEWDTAAGHAVLEAAGGMVLDMEGASLAYGKPGFRNPWFIATTPGVDIPKM